MKALVLACLLFSLVLLQFCTSAKKAASKKPAPLTYEANIKPLIASSCVPCHIPPAGFKKAYDNYTAVKTDIDEMLRRINLTPTEKDFMPFKKRAKLSDSLINVFVQWKADGLLEK
jgi:nitrate/TMAO reductase-like tetraheme cytochrome c subunit